jgi:hypothetical protein
MITEMRADVARFDGMSNYPAIARTFSRSLNVEQPDGPAGDGGELPAPTSRTIKGLTTIVARAQLQAGTGSKRHAF